MRNRSINLRFRVGEAWVIFNFLSEIPGLLSLNIRKWKLIVYKL